MANEYSARNRQIVRLYRARAKRYAFTANAYYLIGYPEWRYRRVAINRLCIQPGDKVLELGCGTGLNFPLLQEKIGPGGQIIAVDLTDAMLEMARRQVVENGWRNVTLIHADALNFYFPANLDGVISTYALSLIPQCDLVIQQAAQALKTGGHLSLLELQIPDYWPGWMVKVAMLLIRPFAPSEEWLARKPWQAISRAMVRNLADVHIEQRYLGSTYIISGGKG